jgi:hypothetical protein
MLTTRPNDCKSIPEKMKTANGRCCGARPIPPARSDRPRRNPGRSRPGDRLAQYVKDHPKNDDAPDAMLQIIRVYESQGKGVEAGAWRGKLVKEHPNSAAAKTVK